MKARRIIEGASFGPDVLDVVRKAFDESWQQVSFVFSPSEHEDAREVLAKAVMIAARDDSNDPRPLREAAIQAMKRQYPSRFTESEDSQKAGEI
ncbi:MAG: hypothetical protein AB7E81_11775 [Hyphomicrobiaceae bacterium]